MAKDSSNDADVQAVRDIALRWIEAIERADVETLTGLMTDDIVWCQVNADNLHEHPATLYTDRPNQP